MKSNIKLRYNIESIISHLETMFVFAKRLKNQVKIQCQMIDTRKLLVNNYIFLVSHIFISSKL